MTHKPRVAYICDPSKNTDCNRYGCTIDKYCRCTTKKQFAKTGENGKPIVALRSDLEWRDDPEGELRHDENEKESN